MVKAKVVKLNNKSRKGTFIYIKENKIPGRYYKYDPKIPIEAYTTFYLSKQNPNMITPSAKTFKKQYKTPKKSTIKRKSVNINKAFKKGISSVTIKNARQISHFKVKKAYKTLLEPLVRDTGILNLITQDTNINKLKNRFQHKILFKNEKGKLLAEGEIIGKTTKDVIKDLKKIMKPKTELRDDYTNNIKLLKNKGYKYSHLNNGKLASIDLEIIFRKG